jgi:hypothetical protein
MNLQSKRVALAHCPGGGGVSAGAAPLDFREDFIDDSVIRHSFAQRGIESLQQLRDGFVIAAHERDTGRFSLGGQRCTADRRDLPDCDLAARVIEESLDILEGCDTRRWFVHGSSGR